ncbi:XdhC family protein [Fictibacillus terranigra]
MRNTLLRTTVIQVLGSAYRREGAMMFFDKDGNDYVDVRC